MLGFNGGTIGIANTVFTGTKSDDPNYSNVSLLLNGNGTNGSTTFTDSSSYGHTVTPVGNAQISTTQSKFGGASMYFDGSGDYLSLPNEANLALLNDDFTIEMWCYLNSYDNEIFFWNCNSSAFGGVRIVNNPNGTIHFLASTNGTSHTTSVPSTATLQLNTWHHIALTKNGSTARVFLDGVIVITTTISSSINNGGINNIGGRSVYPDSMNGYIDDLRITKGVARYTSNFTPPTAQLPGGETGTFASGLWTLEEQSVAIRKELWPGFTIPIVTDGLVLNLDAGDSNSYPGSGTTWYDLSGNGNNGTINGATYSSNNGGYFDFDGVNDYVNFGSSILTSSVTEISCFLWVYPVSDGIILTVLGQSSINTSYHHSSIEIGSSGELRMSLWHNNPSFPNKIISSLSFNTWNNIGFTYSGTTLTGYVNGSTVGNTTFTWSKPTNIYFGVMATDTTNMGTGTYGDGNVSNFLVYNKALTSTEITQNFNALKGRYGL